VDTPARLEGEGHQSRSGLGHREAELARQVVGKAGGAHLGDGFAAGGDDQTRRCHPSVADHDVKSLGRPFDTADLPAGPDGGPGGAQVIGQHGNDLGGRPVAEELAQGLFMEGDALLLDPRDEHFGRVAGEGGEGEAWIVAQEPLAAERVSRVHIGKIAAAAAGNADFLARIAGVVDHEDPTAALARLDARHHAGGSGPQDNHVEIGHFASLAVGRSPPGTARGPLVTRYAPVWGPGSSPATAFAGTGHGTAIVIDSFLFESMRSPAFT
jgi:hypothetical protein